MKVDQNTSHHAQKMHDCHQDLEHLDMLTLQILGNLINEGEIDAELFYGLTFSNPAESSDIHRAVSNSQPRLRNLSSGGIEAELDSQQGFADLLGDGSGAQSSHGASLASPSKIDLKNRRKKDRKKAKRLAANQDPSPCSAPEDLRIAKHDASAISAELEQQDPASTTPDASDISNAPEHPEDHTNTASATISESNLENRTNAEPLTLPAAQKHSSEDLSSAQSDASAASTESKHQAVESTVVNVWRYDQDLLDCHLASCRVKVADHNLATIVCAGCGPKATIRYCSVRHMLADLKKHWHECGHENLLIKRIVDPTTAPARFGRLCPAIRDNGDAKSYALHRQRLYAMLYCGRYTLFDWDNEEPTPLVWTREDVQRKEMERRVERLLNFALFDQRNSVMVGYLFRLLRKCLQLKESWSMGTIYALKKQFREEFGLDPSKVADDQVCECEWEGEGLAETLHLPACGRLYRRFGETFRESGVRGYLERYEARHWILRAWQQQHDAVQDWRDRAAGKGFEGDLEETSPMLGPGWIG